MVIHRSDRRTCRINPLTKMINMTFQELAFNFYSIGYKTQLLDYYSFHPFVGVRAEVSNHHCLTLGKTARSGMPIMMELLISLL